MRLPNAANAVVDIGKLRDYSLSPEHPVGKHKARVFESALGLTRNDARWLREEILKIAQTGEAHPGNPSPFGHTFVIDAPLMVRGRSALVRTARIVEFGMDWPRPVSCYVI